MRLMGSASNPIEKSNSRRGFKQSVIHTKKIEDEVAKQLDKITIPQEFIDWAMEYLESEVDTEALSQEAQLVALNHDEEENEKELRRLNKLYVSGGYEYEGGAVDYKEQQKELLQQRAGIHKRKSHFTNYADGWRTETEKGYEYCRDAAKVFGDPNADHRTKRRVFSSLVQKATIRGDKVILDIGPPFMFIKKKLDAIKQQFGVTEPGKMAELLADTTDPELAEGIKLTWLATWVENQK